MAESSQQEPIVQEYLDSTVPLATRTPDENSLVARLCAEAIVFFRMLIKSLRTPDPSRDFCEGDLVNIHNSYQRLVLWADGYGIPDGDLDDVFTKSSLARRATLEILVSLSQTLVDRLGTLPLLTQHLLSPDFQQTHQNLRYLIQAAVDDCHSSTDSDNGVSSDPGDADIQELCKDLSQDTDALMRLGSLLESPVVDAGPEEAAPGSGPQVWVPHRADSDKIGISFPKAPKVETPGFPVTELRQAIDKCHDIYDGFTDEYTNAPERIKELIDTVGMLHMALQYLDDVHGNIYPSKRMFLIKLRKCETFIDQYKALKQRYVKSKGESALTSRIREGWKSAWLTGRYAFDGAKRAKALNAALILLIQNLVVFFTVLGLKPSNSPLFVPHRYLGPSSPGHSPSPDGHSETLPAYSPGESSTTTMKTPFPPHPNSLPPYPPTPKIKELNSSSQDLSNIHKQLQLLRNRYERTTNSAAQRNRPPDLTHLHDEFESILDGLCSTLGLTKEQRPALPSKDRLLTNPSLAMSDILINLGRSVPSARPFEARKVSMAESTSLGPPPPSIGRGPSPASVFSGPVLTTNKEGTISALGTSPGAARPAAGKAPSCRSLVLPDPATEEYIASILIHTPAKTFTALLGSWECHTEGSSRAIIWKAKEPEGLLEHKLPHDVFPVTLHNNFKKPLHLRFLKDANHPVSWIDDNGQRHPQRASMSSHPSSANHNPFSPEYIFTSTTRHIEFQSALRSKTLLHTFHCAAKWSNRWTVGETMQAVVQLWRDERLAAGLGLGVAGEVCLSFLSDKERRHVELPILGFTKPLMYESGGKTKSLVKLHVPGYGGGGPPSPGLNKWSLGFLSLGSGRPKSDHPGSHPKRGPADSDISCHIPAHHEEVLPGGIKWLALQFKAEEEAEKFAAEVEKAQMRHNSFDPFRTPVWTEE